MREIPLTKGQVAVVDDADFDWLNGQKWCAAWSPNNRSYYARRWYRVSANRYTTYSMHRDIMGLAKGAPEIVDHINRNTLDNRRENLRICITPENKANCGLRRGNKTGFKGVSWAKHANKFSAHITHLGHQKHLGLFVNAEDAARAYDEAAKAHFGEFAFLNFADKSSNICP